MVPGMKARCWVGALVAVVVLHGCRASLGEPRVRRAAGLGAGAHQIECAHLDECQRIAARRGGEYVVIDDAALGEGAAAAPRTGAGAPVGEAATLDASSPPRNRVLLVRCGHPDRGTGFFQQPAPGPRWPSVSP